MQQTTRFTPSATRAEGTARRAVLFRMETPEHVCPFGLKAKALLEREGYEVDDRILRTRAETDDFQGRFGVQSTPQVFIDDRRIGGYDNTRRFFGRHVAQEGDTRYGPVVAVFATALLAATALQWNVEGELLAMQWIGWFVGLSMCLLAVLKLLDLEAFTNRFLGYDLLARRFVRYAYIYPFAELFVGIGMLAGIWPALVASVGLFIGGVGALSVAKAVYIDKRELRCACVGGNSNVPLGAVSLAENLMMVLMGGWMLLSLAR